MTDELWRRYQKALHGVISPGQLPYLDPSEYGEHASQFSAAYEALEALAGIVADAAEALDTLTMKGWAAIAGVLGVSPRSAMRYREDLEKIGVIRHERVEGIAKEQPVALFFRLYAFKLERKIVSQKKMKISRLSHCLP